MTPAASPTSDGPHGPPVGDDEERSTTGGSKHRGPQAGFRGSFFSTLTTGRRHHHAFSKVLGWNVRGHDTDDPRFDDATGHRIGRWVTGGVISREPGLLPYIYVDHIDGAVERVAAHGGEVVRAPYPEGNCRSLAA